MNPVFRLSVVTLFVAPLVSGAAPSRDWPQWRGPDRNGVLSFSPPLMNVWSADGPPVLWDSEAIPSDDDGGHSSVVTAGKRAYVSVVWHREVASETRTIHDLTVRQLGHQSTAGLGAELTAKMEATRESIPATLRGAKLDEFIKEWLDANLDVKQRQLYSGFISGRFKKGKLAIPLGDYAKIVPRQDKPFATEAEFKKWVDEQGFADYVKEAVLAAVTPTKRIAEDTVICLDLETGKTLWKTASPGEPRGRGCSSTPCVAGGRVFAMGSTHLYGVDAANGTLLWSQSLPAKAPGSSPLVADGTVVILAGRLAAFDAATGKKLWEQPKVAGNNSSPAAWSKDGRTVILCNSRNDVAGVDLKSGDVLWTAPGGGDSTPALAGDLLAVYSRNTKVGLAGFKISATGAEKLWNIPLDPLRTQSSPLVHQGHVYLFDDGDHMCVKLDTGTIAWRQKVPSNITSPVLADGKIFVLANNGNNLLMVKATPDERVELGKAAVKALWVPSPCIADGKLLLRMKNGVRCLNLAATVK